MLDSESVKHSEKNGRHSRPIDAQFRSKSSSFVFTSSKIARFHQRVPTQAEPPSSVVVRDPSPGTCGLTPDQILTHALGASHALPEWSSFRRLRADDRPSPLKSISILPERPSREKRIRSNTTCTGISLYLQSVGRNPCPPNTRRKFPTWSTYSEPLTQLMPQFISSQSMLRPSETLDLTLPQSYLSEPEEALQSSSPEF